MLISGKASNLCSCHCLSSTTACNYSTNVYILLFEAFSLKALAFDIFAISKKQKSFSRLLVKLYFRTIFLLLLGDEGSKQICLLFGLYKKLKKLYQYDGVQKILLANYNLANCLLEGVFQFSFPLVSISALSNFSPYFIAQILTKYSWYLHSPRIWRTHTKGRFHHLVEKENHYREVGDLPNC